MTWMVRRKGAHVWALVQAFDLWGACERFARKEQFEGVVEFSVPASVVHPVGEQRVRRHMLRFVVEPVEVAP